MMKKYGESIVIAIWGFYPFILFALALLSHFDVISKGSAATAGVSIFVIKMTATVIYGAWETKQEMKDDRKNDEELNEKIKNESASVVYIWDIAARKLENYIDRNRRHLSLIFMFSMIAMVTGFGLIAGAVFLAFTHPEKMSAAEVALIGGGIAEFISATFLFFYRSALKQASQYTNTLERLNDVAMAAKFLEEITGDESDLQNKTRAELVKLIMRRNLSPETIAQTKS